jgi:3-isopropylmalate/(R)-2-methylmalate dehydratase small subunit
MKSFSILKSIVAPLVEDDINTDQIIPSEYLKDIHADLKFGLFAYQRRDPNGISQKSFVLEKEEFLNANILLTGKNFGCGSSREHAVWALQEFGFQCIIAKSFSELFKNNCLKNGILTIELQEDIFIELEREITGNFEVKYLTVDLPKQALFNDEGTVICNFNIDLNTKLILMEGIDEIDMTLKEIDSVSLWESKNDFNMLLQKPIAKFSN